MDSVVTAALLAATLAAGIRAVWLWMRETSKTGESVTLDTETALWIAATALLGLADKISRHGF